MLALDLDRGARLAREARDRLGIAERIGQQELDRHALLELKVRRGDDHAHPALAEHPLDAELSGQDLAFVNLGRHFDG